QKFLDDAARSVCRARVALDQDSPADDRVLLRFVPATADEQATPAQVDANLQHLLRRFHQRRVRREDPELVGWRFQFEATRFGGATGPEAWEAVCVALMTHPDFYTY
ncbi:MAG: hypothetical protein KC613_19115, partial [Myxococcales bacterium]|nr:hypothetical protein [Myxococcales bacterium]